MAFFDNPELNQQMAQLEREFAQRRSNLMQNFYGQQQNNWNQQNAQMQNAVSSQNVNWIYVSGVEGARKQIVQQNCTAWMMDNNEPYIYAKAVDKFGTPDFHIFRIEEVPDVSQEHQEQFQVDLSGYVQRSEFEQLKAQIKQLTNMQQTQPASADKEVVSDGKSTDWNDGKQTTASRNAAGRPHADN